MVNMTSAYGGIRWGSGMSRMFQYEKSQSRLGKPVWMLNYNGEPHGLRKYQNKKDWAIRMQQFFDHYLKGAQPPVWLALGVPAVHKGKTLGLELIQVGAATTGGEER